jgi:hypothetical protein
MLQFSNMHKLGMAQFVLLTLPLYFTGYIPEAVVSFSMICLYLLIDVNLNFLARIGKALRWSRIAVILTGFFGIKNIFFILCIILFWRANLLRASFGIVAIILLNYAINSFLLGRKLLTMPYERP